MAHPGFRPKNGKPHSAELPGLDMASISVYNDPMMLTWGFRFMSFDIPGKFDRNGIYKNEFGQIFLDDAERYSCFQQAVLQWVLSLDEKPEIIHCHDNHTGLIPFLMKYGNQYNSLAHIPTVFTIHNGQYHGAFPWDHLHLVPHFVEGGGSLLDWNHQINPLAGGIKTAWKVTTVSPSYMLELSTSSNGLETLLQQEFHKCVGILNGIDADVWDPKTDEYLHYNLKTSVRKYKLENKKFICKQSGLSLDKPLITFIGRFVYEKAADILPDVVYQCLTSNIDVNLFVLGSGNQEVQRAFDRMKPYFQGRFNDYIGYNEKLAHILYAASDFLLMPSRVEPCGLNQMYAMRYGTVPIVRRTGGLNDSVKDIGDPDGSGIMFQHATTSDVLHALWRASQTYLNEDYMKNLREQIMALDFSWQHSAQKYYQLYQELKTSA